MPKIIEIRSYELKPGMRAEFHRLVREESRPLLEKHGTDVVAARASLGDENGFVLIRAYRDVMHRDQDQAAFYGSAAWRDGPRESIIACIENHTSVMMEADDATIDGLRDKVR
jgi:NIPSNAP